MNKYLNNIKSSKINYLANFRCLIKAKNHILISLLIVILTVIHTLELKSAIPHIVSTISLRIIAEAIKLHLKHVRHVSQ